MTTNSKAPAQGPADYADLGSIIKDLYSPVLIFAIGLTKSETDAADLVQQTFLTLSQKLHQIRDFTKIKCWLFTTVHRNFLRQIRRHRRHPEVEFRSDVHDVPATIPEAWRLLDAKDIREAFSQVDEAYRAVLESFYIDELSYREIAERFKIPAGTVMSRLARGKEQLRTIVFREEHGKEGV